MTVQVSDLLCRQPGFTQVQDVPHISLSLAFFKLCTLAMNVHLDSHTEPPTYSSNVGDIIAL